MHYGIFWIILKGKKRNTRQRVGENKFRLLIKIAIAVLIVLCFVFGFGVSRIKVEYDFEKFFPLNDKETDFFQEHRNKFESDVSCRNSQ